MGTKYWRDLELGESIQAGDRFLADGESWLLVDEEYLRYSNVVNRMSHYIQRQAECVPPIENGKNRYGLDVSYFRNVINRELNRGLTDYKPDELARVFARLSVTADSSVIFEDEFQRRNNNK